MSVRRLESIPGFNIDRVAAAAGDDPDILRMENLDTDIPPPTAALEATRAAIGEDEANSWLPFTGRDDLKEAVAAYIERHGGPRYDGRREIVITSGEGDAMLDALFCLTDPGDEVVLTDPTTPACSIACASWASRRVSFHCMPPRAGQRFTCL
jgi:aspartate/methionine/tyrosine aminotransferase